MTAKFVRKFLLLSLWLGIQFLSAQNVQNAFFLSETLNPQILNPAMVGLDEANHLFAGGRFYWLGFDEAPTSGFLGLDTRLGARRLGVGGYLRFDDAGLLSQVQGNLQFSVQLIQNDLSNLALGFSGSFQSLQVSPPNVEDPLIGSSELSGSQVNMGIGAAFQRRFNEGNSRLQIGLAVPTFASKLDLVEVDGDFLAFNQAASFIAQVALHHQVNDGLELSPYLQFQTGEGKSTVDLGLRGRLGSLLNLGLGFRSGETALYGIVGISINGKSTLLMGYEPFGPFGHTVDVGLDVPWGRRGVIDSKPKKPQKELESPPVAISQASWQRASFWQNRFTEMGLGTRIRTKLTNTPTFVDTDLSFDYDDTRITYDISQTPYEQILLEELTGILQAFPNLRIDSAALRYVLSTPLENSSEAIYDEGTRDLIYEFETLPIGSISRKNSKISINSQLSQGDLGALKLESLGRVFTGRLGISSQIIQLVVLDTTQPSSTPPRIEIYLRLSKD